MKAIIYCFSGTGNTLLAARETAKALSGQGYQTDIYRIVSENAPLYANAWERCVSYANTEVCSAAGKEGVYETGTEYGAVPDPNGYDIAGFAYPIHAFNAPQFFLRFVKALPKLSQSKQGMHAFLFKTSGEPFAVNHASSWPLYRILKKKGFLPSIDMHMLMPYNIMFRYPEAMAKQMVLHTKQMSLRLARMVADGDFTPVEYSLFNILFTYPFRIQWPAAKVNGWLHRVKADACTSCEKCVNACPSGNIRMVGYTSKEDPNTVTRIPKIGFHCTMCMQCTMGCPKAAINPGVLTPWKVNPGWDFARLLSDDSIPSNWTDKEEAGYFKLFRKYYSNESELRYDPWDNISDEAHDGGSEADTDADGWCRPLEGHTQEGR